MIQKLGISLGLAVILMVLSSSAPLVNAAPPITTADPFSGQDSFTVEMVFSPGKCEFTTEVDNVHASRTQGDVSVHGGWRHTSRFNGICPEYADVTVQLQAGWHDRWGRRFITIDQNTARIRQGFTSSGRRRVNARFTCPSEVPTAWRAVVDVDLVGVIDSPGKKYTIPGNLPCRPW